MMEQSIGTDMERSIPTSEDCSQTIKVGVTNSLKKDSLLQEISEHERIDSMQFDDN